MSSQGWNGGTVARAATPDRARSGNRVPGRPDQRTNRENRSAENRSGTPHRERDGRRHDRSDRSSRHARDSRTSSRGSDHRSVSFRFEDHRSGIPMGVPELKGKYFVFDVDGQEAMFIITRKALAEHAVKEYETGRFLHKLVMKGEDTEFKDPEKLTDVAAKKLSEARTWEYKMKKAEDNRRQYAIDKASFIIVILGQCVPEMRRELDSMEEPFDLDYIFENNHVKGLIDSIRNLVFHLDAEGKVYLPWTQQAMWRRLLQLQQPSGQSIELFGRLWLAQCEAVEELWGRLTPQMITADVEETDDASNEDEQGAVQGASEEEQTEAANKFKASLFLAAVDQHRFGQVINDLHNNYLTGKNDFPATVSKVISLLKRRRDVTGRDTNRRTDGLRYAVFAQEDINDLEEDVVVYDEEDDEEAEPSATQHYQQIAWNMHPNGREAFSARAAAFNARSGHYD